jgi:hypothetical protein
MIELCNLTVGVTLGFLIHYIRRPRPADLIRAHSMGPKINPTRRRDYQERHPRDDRELKKRDREGGTESQTSNER